MRIVQIGPYPISRDCIQGGVEASVFGLVQQQSRDSEVHAFDIPRIGGASGVEKDGSVAVHRFSNLGKRNAFALFRVKRIVAEIVALKPDVCHVHGTELLSWLIYRQLKRKNVKVVVTVHGLALVEKRNLLKKGITVKRVFQYVYKGLAEKRFLSSLSFAIVDTEYVREKINEYTIRHKPIMHVIPQGINERYFKVKCSRDSRTLMSVGAIGERKGHLLTLKAFERVRDLGIDCKLIIVGTISSQSYYEKLKTAVGQSNYCEAIEIRLDVPANELMQVFETSHVFVLHSEEESQGIAIVEAMATGMPVVATKVGGIPFVVSDGVAGFLAEYGDVVGFADSIIKLLTNFQLWQDFSDASVFFANAFHWKNINNKVKALYGSDN